MPDTDEMKDVPDLGVLESYSAGERGLWSERYPRWSGAAQLCGLHLCLAAFGLVIGGSGALSGAGGLLSGAAALWFFLTFFAFGLTQLLYAIPLVLFLRSRGKPEVAGGVVRAVFVTVVLNVLWVAYAWAALLSHR